MTPSCADLLLRGASYATMAVPLAGAGAPLWLSYGSFAISAGAVVISLSNRRTARRSLQLSEQQEARRDSRIDLYLIDSLDEQPTSGDRLLAFQVLISNPSDRDNSIVAAEVHLTYSLEAVVTSVKVRHGIDRGTSSAFAGVKPLDLPVALDANGAVSGWLLFRIDSALTGGRPVDRYDLVIQDVHGTQESRQVTVINRLAHE